MTPSQSPVGRMLATTLALLPVGPAGAPTWLGLGLGLGLGLVLGLG